MEFLNRDIKYGSKMMCNCVAKCKNNEKTNYLKTRKKSSFKKEINLIEYKNLHHQVHPYLEPIEIYWNVLFPTIDLVLEKRSQQFSMEFEWQLQSMMQSTWQQNKPMTFGIAKKKKKI